MSAGKGYYIGLDSGSVSLNTVIIDADGTVRREWYDRLKGDPFRACRLALERISREYPEKDLLGVALTGSGDMDVVRIMYSFQDLPECQGVSFMPPRRIS